ncbi:hypothetical protein LCGC14_0395060 [marine sediment metagenome]|uniref:Uncharacterized protein n=1 Tax=marine sediment metagenome TaxID=412755 RepID=A0A0F9VKB2_9ZZZZ
MACSTMLASEEVLGRDWNLPEEDEAWKYLSDKLQKLSVRKNRKSKLSSREGIDNG